MIIAAIRQVLITRRKELGLTRSGVAKRMGVSSTHVTNLEEGVVTSPGIDMVTRWADALGYDMELNFKNRAKDVNV